MWQKSGHACPSGLNGLHCPASARATKAAAPRWPPPGLRCPPARAQMKSGQVNAKRAGRQEGRGHLEGAHRAQSGVDVAVLRRDRLPHAPRHPFPSSARRRRQAEGMVARTWRFSSRSLRSAVSSAWALGSGSEGGRAAGSASTAARRADSCCRQPSRAAASAAASARSPASRQLQRQRRGMGKGRRWQRDRRAP